MSARSHATQVAHPALIASFQATLALCVALGLGSCASSRSHINYSDEGTNSATDAAANAYPTNYKTDLLAFLRTYLNDPTHVRDASIAEPVLKPLGKTTRYVACVRYAARKDNGEYGTPREGAAVYIGGKFSQLIDARGDVCAGAAFQPFPELEHLTRS